MATLPPAAPDPTEPEPPLVHDAIAQVIAYAGHDVLRADVRDFLPHWHGYGDLTRQQIVMILKAFKGKGDPGTRAHSERHPMMYDNGRPS